MIHTHTLAYVVYLFRSFSMSVHSLSLPVLVSFFANYTSIQWGDYIIVVCLNWQVRVALFVAISRLANKLTIRMDEERRD